MFSLPPAGASCRRAVLAAAVAVAALAVPAAAAHAAVVNVVGGFSSPTRGVAVTADGTLFVTEPAAGTVARVAPNGQVLSHVPVGGDATSVAAASDGSVWVTVPSAQKLVRIESSSPFALSTSVSTAGLSSCGPTAIADGGNGQMYFSMPRDGVCTSVDLLGRVSAGAAVDPVWIAGRGRALGLAAAAGKLYVPDDDGQVIRRLALDDALTVESTVATPGAASPESIAVAGPDVYVGLGVANTVARYPAAQDGGSALALPHAFGLLTLPLAIAPFGSGVLAAGADSANVTTVGADGSYVFTALPAGARPLDIATGTDGDAWIADGSASRILHYVDAPPRLGPGSATAGTSATATFLGQVESRGNETQVVVDVGTSTAYGTSTAPISLPGGTVPASEQIALTGLAPATTYHARLRATNLRGSAVTPDVTFRTPAAPAAHKPPRIAARASFSSSVTHGLTRITRLKLVKLVGGERARITCSSHRKGCPFAARSYTKLKRGTRNLSSLFGARHPLKPGVKVGVTITKAATVGSGTVMTTRAHRKPLLVGGCVVPGTAMPATC